MHFQIRFCTFFTDLSDIQPDTSVELCDVDDSLHYFSLSSEPEPDSPEFQAWVPNLALTEVDKHTLCNGDWLNANHIAAGNKLLKARFLNQNGLQDTCLLSKKRWNSKPEEFIQILHVAGNHWVCASNKLSADHTVEIFDSLHIELKEDGETASLVSCILATDRPSFDLDLVNVHRQRLYNDCGLFALAFAFDLCSGDDPYESLYDQDAMRSHLVKCFERQEFKQFPRVTENSLLPKRRVRSTITVKVYCHCRELEKCPMASCDKCHEWYHDTCEQIPLEVFSNPDTPWTCSLCKKGYILLLYVHNMWFHSHLSRFRRQFLIKVYVANAYTDRGRSVACFQAHAQAHVHILLIFVSSLACKSPSCSCYQWRWR